jgi:hypothetical protein
VNRGRTVRVLVTEWARDDLRAIQPRHPDVVVKVLSLLQQLESGRLQVRRLRSFGKTGDLSDCGKIPVLVDGAPEHRIVVRELGDGDFEIVEVVAVEERADDLVYLLTALRLSRLVQPAHRSDMERRVARVLAVRRAKQGD